MMRKTIFFLIACLFLLTSCAAIPIEDQRNGEAGYYFNRAGRNLGI